VTRDFAAVLLVLTLWVFPVFPQRATESSGPNVRDELYRQLSASLERAEGMVAASTLQGEALTGEQMQSLVTLNRQIRGSLYSDLIDRSDLLLLLAEEQMRIGPDTGQQLRLESILQDSLRESSARERSREREKAFRSSMTTALISFALSFTFWTLGEAQDRRYFESPTIDEARHHRRLFQVFAVGSAVSAAVGVVSGGVSAMLYMQSR
jgi:hypothetical protein